MAVKAVTHYRTKNREALLAYLRSREGEHVTVSEMPRFTASSNSL